MTEEEKREKIIEELRKIGCGEDKDECDFCSTHEHIRCPILNMAYEACDYVLRKADEARKEKAKEIYKAVLDLRELIVNNDDALCILRNVESWAKEDGVEVEE